MHHLFFPRFPEIDSRRKEIEKFGGERKMKINSWASHSFSFGMATLIFSFHLHNCWSSTILRDFAELWNVLAPSTEIITVHNVHLDIEKTRLRLLCI